jgi:microcystin-dependent protein
MSQYISFEAPVPPPAEGVFGNMCVAYDQKWHPYIIGALQALIDASTYESDAVRAKDEAADLILLFQTGVCEVGLKVGMIVEYVTTSVPAGCLACDGGSYLRTAYPALYAALHSSYKTDADHFVTPDFRGKAPIGIGTGAGLTARAMNASIGAETHVITLAKSPAHSHTFSAYNGGHNTSSGGNVDTSANSGGPLAYPTNSLGGGSPHNNMQPSLAVGFCIVAS